MHLREQSISGAAEQQKYTDTLPASQTKLEDEDEETKL
jgi:hypothetical protein